MIHECAFMWSDSLISLSAFFSNLMTVQHIIFYESKESAWNKWLSKSNELAKIHF